MGQLLQQLTLDNEIANFGYNKNGQLTSVGKWNSQLTFEYTRFGQVTKEMQNHHEICHEYDLSEAAPKPYCPMALVLRMAT